MKRKITIIGVILVLIFAAAGYVYFFVYNKAHPDYADLAADHKVTANQLYDSFTSDAASAQQKFNGKMVQVSGNPTKIETVDSLVIAVFVFNEGMFGDEGVRCTFLKADAAHISDVSDLEGHAIKGFCTGYNDTDVILEKCTLVKLN